MKKQTDNYDYAIVGAGAAGLQLALRLLGDPATKDQAILIIEPDLKNTNDRTWCFWEKGAGEFDHLLTRQWTKCAFHAEGKSYQFELAPYSYKMLRSKDFYTYAKAQLSARDNVIFMRDRIASIDEKENPVLIGETDNYQAKHVFDSRIDAAFNNTNGRPSSLLQHFKGWVIETNDSVFDSTAFTMMDFRLKWQESCSFTYVLPITDKKALVEFTFFNQQLVGDEVYDEMLKKYCRQILKLENYTIVETEKGIIPMSDYPFHKHHSNRITKIGTAGGWVKPSTGYSFKNGSKYSDRILSNINNNRSVTMNLPPSDKRVYDSIFLEVLARQNHLGERIFHAMYSKCSIQQIFKFLDEETSLFEELRIITKLPALAFSKGFFRMLQNKSGLTPSR